MIRRMAKTDIYDITNLYINYMFNSFFTEFGRDFLYIIFEGMINSRYGINFVYEEDSQIAGFISATTNTQQLLKGILERNKFSLLSIIFFSLVRKPQLLIPILGSFLYFRKTKLGGVKAELLFIAIDPNYRNKGVSKDLINIALAELRRVAISKVKVNTLNNNHIVNNLLQNLGFNLAGSFKFYGKKNLLYELTFY